VGAVKVGPVRLTVITSDLVTLSVQSRLRAGGATSSSFTIEGTQPKSILVRAAGPAVATLFETAVNHLLDPRVRVYDRQLAEVGANNDWGTNATFAAANQAGVTPGFADGSKDAAVLLSLAPGTYTAVVDGNDGGGGLALLQIYDLEPARPRIVMLTARGQVGTGSDVLVAGFTLAGALPRKLLFRAPGEQLLDGFYVESGRILYDPMIYVYSSSNEQLAYNDDWPAENADIIAAAARVGAPPFNGYTLDTAILKELAPGNYSAQLVGYGGSVGESLIEIFEVDEQRAVASPPALTWVPSNQMGIAGHEAVFSVHAVGRPAVSYQWRRNGTNIVGATRQALRLENLQATDEKIDGVPVTYDVVVTNSEGSVTSPARTLTLLPQYHAADSDRDGRIGLYELTRLIELYNFRSGGNRTGEYRSQAGSEDGFMPGPGTIASHHSADSNRDGRFDLAELTRVIELYNFTNDTVRTGEYHPEIGTEDGFALGPYFFNEGGDEVRVPPPR
jgi:hypothetical protein